LAVEKQKKAGALLGFKHYELKLSWVPSWVLEYRREPLSP